MIKFKKEKANKAPKQQENQEQDYIKKAKEGSLYKFRRHKRIDGSSNNRQKHIKLIVEENKEDYGYMGITSSSHRGHHKNYEFQKNPERGNKEKSYLRKELRYDKKDNFSEILKKYHLSAKDKEYIIKYLEERKKKK